MAFRRRRSKEAEAPVGEDAMLGLGVALVVHVDLTVVDDLMLDISPPPW